MTGLEDSVVKPFWRFLARQIRISGILSKKRLEILLLPLHGMLVHHSLPSPSFRSSLVTHLYLDGERHCDRRTNLRTQQ